MNFNEKVYTTSILKLFPEQDNKKLIKLFNEIQTELNNHKIYELFYKIEHRSNNFEKNKQKALMISMNKIQVFNKKSKKKLKGEQKKLLLKIGIIKNLQNYYEKSFHHLREAKDKLRCDIKNIIEDIIQEIENQIDELINFLKEIIKITLELNGKVNKLKKTIKKIVNVLSGCLKSCKT